MSTPNNNELPSISEPAQKNEMYKTEMSSGQQSSVKTSNQDNILKQIMAVMQDVANRPVQVQIAGVELRSLNNKMKVYNNK